MRCVVCGVEMHLVQVARENALTVPGYEQHTFQCPGCDEVERRLVFNRARRSLSGRNVQIGRDSRDEAAYAAKDAKSGMVVMRHADSARLRELCDWIGWQVVDGRMPSSDE
jgi:hypothetical protein